MIVYVGAILFQLKCTVIAVNIVLCLHLPAQIIMPIQRTIHIAILRETIFPIFIVSIYPVNNMLYNSQMSVISFICSSS